MLYIIWMTFCFVAAWGAFMYDRIELTPIYLSLGVLIAIVSWD